MSFWIWFWAIAALVFLLLRPSILATEVSQTHRWLIQAGYRDTFRVKYYFGARILLAAAGFARVSFCSLVSTIPFSWPVFPAWDSSFPASSSSE